MDDPRETTSGPASHALRGLGGGALSRRALLLRSAAVAAGAGLTTLLAACGGSSAPATTTSSSTATTSTSGTGASTQTAGGTSAQTSTPTANGSATPATSTGQAATNNSGAAPWFSPSAAGKKPKTGGTLNMALNQESATIDPHKSRDIAGTQIKGLVYSQLLKYYYNKQLVPDVAERYEAVNATTYVFTLRQGVKFHDGSPLTAADVVASYQRILDPAIGASSYQYLKGIDTVTATNDSTVQFTLKAPQATFIPAMGLPGTYIAQKSKIDAKVDFEKVVVGTGPFTFVSRTVGTETKLARNPNYFLPNLPYLDAIVFRPIFDDSARMNALYAGDEDLVTYVPWAQMSEVEHNPKLVLQSNPQDGFVMLEFRVDQPPFNNQQLRQAVSYGIDRQAIIETATSHRGASCYGGIIPTWMWGFSKALENTYEYNPTKAKQLVQEAHAEGLNVQLITWPSSNQLFGAPSVVVANQLKAIGINVTLVPMQTAQWSLVRQQGNYHLFMDGNLYDIPDPDFLSQYYETGGRIPAANRFSEKSIDGWLDQARTLTNQAQREPLYEDVQKAGLDLEPIAWLFYREQGEAIQTYVQGHAYLGSQGANNSLLEVWLDR